MDPKQENTPSQPQADAPVPAPMPETPQAPQPAPAAEEPKQESAPAQPTPPPTSPIDPTSSASTPPAPMAPAEPHQKEDHHVSIRTVLLIVFLAILAAVLLFVALRPAKKAVVQNITPTPTAKPSQAHSTLSLVMPDTTATPSGAGITTKSVNVVVTTQSNKVSGVQFEIAYDPTVVTNVIVKPGDFFTKPLVLLNQVDTKNGKINYAVGIQPTAEQISGTGTVAVISYTLLPTASASQTTLKFLPKTQVVQQGVTGSVLEKSFDLSIPVAGLTPAVIKSGLPTAPQAK